MKYEKYKKVLGSVIVSLWCAQNNNTYNFSKGGKNIFKILLCCRLTLDEKERCSDSEMTIILDPIELRMTNLEK